MRPFVGTAVAAALVAIVLAGAACAPRPAGEDVAKEQQEAAGTVIGTAGRIHVDDGGAGEGRLPVVFVHSFAGSGAHWDTTLAHLRPSRRALALDLRGHGRSEAPAPGGYAVDSLAGDIAAVADQLGLERFVLVGHSLGGVAGAAYAGAHPQKVAGLVLVGTPGPSPPELARQVLARMEANYDSTSRVYWDRLLEGGTEGTKTRIRAEMASLPKEAGLEIIGAIFAYDPMPALRAYGGPVLLVDTPHGEGPGAIHRLAPPLPRHVIAGTSHWPQLDRPAEFQAILDAFVARVEADSSVHPDSL